MLIEVDLESHAVKDKYVWSSSLERGSDWSFESRVIQTGFSRTLNSTKVTHKITGMRAPGPRAKK